MLNTHGINKPISMFKAISKMWNGKWNKNIGMNETFLNYAWTTIEGMKLYNLLPPSHL